MKPNSQIAYVQADGRLTLDGMRLFLAQAEQIARLEGKLAAIRSIALPAGGATVDTQARAAIAAIIGAA